jgi:hypothetical protein
LLAPAAATAVVAVAGEREPDVFRRQGLELVDAWRALGCDASYADSPGDNHFTLLSRLDDANDPLVARIAELALTAQIPQVSLS